MSDQTAIVRKTFTLPTAHVAELERRARQADRSLSAEVRRAVRLYLSVPSQQPRATVRGDHTVIATDRQH